MRNSHGNLSCCVAAVTTAVHAEQSLSQNKCSKCTYVEGPMGTGSEASFLITSESIKGKRIDVPATVAKAIFQFRKVGSLSCEPTRYLLACRAPAGCVTLSLMFE